MGLLDALAGRQHEVSTDEVAAELAPFLVEGEQVEHAFKLVRDMMVFTHRRLFTIDRQGTSGRKVDYRTIPYSRITQYAKEAAGMFDWDAELKIWVGANTEPLSFTFNRQAPIDSVYRILSAHILR
jgi:hypothetical protein